MKPVSTIAACLLLLIATATAQERVTVEAFEVTLNTAENLEVWLEFTLSDSLDDGTSFDSYVATGIEARLVFAEPPCDTIPLDQRFTPNRLSFVLWPAETGVLGSAIKRLLGGEGGAYIEVSADIPLVLVDGAEAVLLADDIREVSADRLHMTEAQRDIIAGFGVSDSEFERDRFEVNREIDEADSARAEYVAHFHFTQPLLGSPVSIGATGRVSDRKDNPLNEVELRLRRSFGRIDSLRVLNRLFLLDFFGSARLKGPQTFDTANMYFSLGLRSIIPNLLDLTGGVNRLRLKPVVSVSFDYIRHLRTQSIFGDADDSWGATIDFWYYIPLVTKLAIIVDSRATYNTELVIDHGWAVRHAVELAYDLPLEDLKAIVKWETGKNEFLSHSEKQLLFGLMTDYLGF